MSRTDKDKPWWVRSERYEPVHDHRCAFNTTRSRWAREPVWPCTLPARPVRHRVDWTFRPCPTENYCTWEPVWPNRWRYNYTRGPSKQERHADWWGPVRALDQVAGRRARDEYRAGGELSEPKVHRNHRHCSIKGWWD